MRQLVSCSKINARLYSRVKWPADNAAWVEVQKIRPERAHPHLVTPCFIKIPAKMTGGNFKMCGTFLPVTTLVDVGVALRLLGC